MWMYSNEKEKGKETPKEFQKKEDIWIYSTERKKEIIFAYQRHFNEENPIFQIEDSLNFRHVADFAM